LPVAGIARAALLMYFDNANALHFSKQITFWKQKQVNQQVDSEGP